MSSNRTTLFPYLRLFRHNHCMMLSVVRFEDLAIFQLLREGMVFGGLPIPGIGCPVPDVGNIYLYV